MSALFGHKLYQNEVLASLRNYLRRCAETGDPGRAFREVTEELWGLASDYRAVTNLPEGVSMRRQTCRSSVCVCQLVAERR